MNAITNKCYEEELLAYIEGILTSERNTQIKEHLLVCKRCASKLNSLNKVHSLLKEGKEIIFSEIRETETCPETETLMKYHDKIGALSIQEIEKIKKHISSCSSCEEILQILKRSGELADEEYEFPKETAKKLLDLSIAAYPPQKTPPSKSFLQKVGERLARVKEQFEVQLFPNAPELSYAYYEMGGKKLNAGKIVISVEEKTGKFKKYEFQCCNITIGRSDDNDIILSEDTVSAHHAQIKFENNVYVIYDLTSTNGTWFNNRKIKALILSRQGEVRLGKTKIIFEVEFI